jgi:hypothetical protein
MILTSAEFESSMVRLTLVSCRRIGIRILQWYHLFVRFINVMRNYRLTNDSPDITDDGSFRGIKTREALGSLQIYRVQILTSMREEIESYLYQSPFSPSLTDTYQS